MTRRGAFRVLFTAAGAGMIVIARFAVLPRFQILAACVAAAFALAAYVLGRDRGADDDAPIDRTADDYQPVIIAPPSGGLHTAARAAMVDDAQA